MIDYRLNLLKILWAIGCTEGIIFDREWKDFGVTEEDKQQILKELDEYENTL